MEWKDTVAARRSIRRFRPDPVPGESLRAVMEAAISAPSAKNRQPWRFVVVTGAAKESMLRAMAEGIAREGAGNGLLPHLQAYAASARHSLDIMAQAPVSILVLNTEAPAMETPADLAGTLLGLTNVQSIGAAIENLLLAAVDEGLGALWVCDVFFAYHELVAWLGTDRQLVAAVALGVPDEAPTPRPRRPLADVVEWRSE